MTEGNTTIQTKAEAPPKRFFAYAKAEHPTSIEEQRKLCRAFVAAQGGAIVDEAFDVGAGAIVDMPGYARLYDALVGATVDGFVTDMTVFGPTMILGLFSACAVGGVEMWDLARGRVTAEQIRALGESLRHGLEASETVHDMLGPKSSMN
jgi:hypothetical protein